MQKIKNIKKIFIKILLLLIFVAISSNSATVCAFSVAEEKEVGTKLLNKVRTYFQLFDDPDVVQYINELGAEVVDAANDDLFDYRFFIINDKEFNAFAAPSGLVFFHSGLVETMQDENELVSVMAHEIGHIAKRHIASRIEKGQKTNLASLGLALAGIALGEGKAAQAIVTGSLAAGQALNLSFSRKDEEEADLFAFDLMKKLKRNPIAQERMLQIMRRVMRYRMEKAPRYLLTHPNPEERLDYVQSLLVIDSQKNIDPKFGKVDNFKFNRIKIRILNEVKPINSLRVMFLKTIDDSKLNKNKIAFAKYGLSLLNKNENKLNESINLLKEVIEAFPDRPVLLTDLGVVQMLAGQYKLAGSNFVKAYNANNNDAYSAFELAKYYILFGEYAKAERILFDMTRTLKELPQPYFELAKIRSKHGVKEEENYFLGKYYFYKGKNKIAEQKLNQSINSQKLSPSMHKDAMKFHKLIKEIQED